jgi:crotonobetainyl-CoA:carnitine CoA-transferase CaiB-like acyl-CoA transferase
MPSERPWAGSRREIKARLRSAMLCSMSLKNEVFTATIDQTIRSDIKHLIIAGGDDKPANPLASGQIHPALSVNGATATLPGSVGEQPMPGPLAGLRVLELARILAGPWAGQILADLGADVIKVERRGAGDDTRGWGPPFVPATDGGHLGAAYFHGTNRGKRSIELDFDSEEGRRIVRKLAARSDVLIENFKVGGLAKFGLDYQSLAPANPRLIYCSVTGFGQTGPYAQRPGYDLMAQGMGGMMDLTGNPDGEPMRAGVPVSDLFTGVYSAVGILAALARREKTGRGGSVDAALVDSTVGVLSYQALNYLVSGDIPKRIGNTHPNLVPYQVFPVADGSIIIATGNDNQFVKLCGILGDPQLAKVPDYKDNTGRLAHRTELVGRLSALTSRLPRDVLLEKLETAGIPAGPINNLEQVFADPQVIHRGMRLELSSAVAEGGKIPGVRTPIMLDGAAMASDRPAPRLGEHSAEILREIGEG